MSANHVAVLNNSVEAREDGEGPGGKISRKTAAKILRNIEFKLAKSISSRSGSGIGVEQRKKRWMVVNIETVILF